MTNLGNLSLCFVFLAIFGCVHNVSGKVGGPDCTICEFAMKEIESQLTQNATEEEIVHAVENICTVLPSTLKAECTSFVDAYGPVLISLLVHKLDPKTVCSHIGLCTQDTAGFKTKPAQDKASPAECARCQQLMTQLEGKISKSSTESEIKDALYKMCFQLPGTAKSQCQLFVNQHIYAISQQLIAGSSPYSICRSMELCEMTSVSAPDVSCCVCQQLMIPLDLFIMSNRTQKEILEDFTEECTLQYAGDLLVACKNFVATDGAKIPAILVKELLPMKICQDLGACTAGNEVCCNGPAAWCASMHNAKLCNAVDHCQNHVWN